VILIFNLEKVLSVLIRKHSPWFTRLILDRGKAAMVLDRFILEIRLGVTVKEVQRRAVRII
jgi:hypothetical protein